MILRNPADTAAVLTYGHSCFFTLDPIRVLDDGGEVPMVVDGADYGCHAVIWSDNVTPVLPVLTVSFEVVDGQSQ